MTCSRSIGRGGAAVVYLAQQRDLQRHVALKELAPYQAADTSFAARFVEESRLAGSMSHANVVTVHEYFEDGGRARTSPWSTCPTARCASTSDELSTAQIAGVLEGVLAGLSHGEAHGIVHRDLKPENLLVAVDGRVKIADFGVARAYNQAVTRAVVTVAGTTIGTPTYMSPEQALGTDLTPATDLYSLGVVAWELLTGQVPVRGDRHPGGGSLPPRPRAGAVGAHGRPGGRRGDRRLAGSGCSRSAPRTATRAPTRPGWTSRTWCSSCSGPRWRRQARLIVDQDARRDDGHADPGRVPRRRGPPRPRAAAAARDAGHRSRRTLAAPGLGGRDRHRPKAGEPEATVAPRRQPRAQPHDDAADRPPAPRPGAGRGGGGAGHAAPAPGGGGDRVGHGRWPPVPAICSPSSAAPARHDPIPPGSGCTQATAAGRSRTPRRSRRQRRTSSWPRSCPEPRRGARPGR